MAKQRKPLTEQSADTDMHPIAKALFGWVGHVWTGRIILWGLVALSVVLIFADLAHHRHVEEDIEGITGFYGLYGFVAFSFVVLMGRPLGWLLRRREDYYGDDDESHGSGS